MSTLRKKVALEGLRFYAFHGFYPEEQVLGNEFEVDIETECEAADDGSDNLEDTINYEKLFEIASAEMRQSRKLIETVAINILGQVKERFPFILSATVRIRKMHLPLKGEMRNALVEYRYRA